MTAAVAPMGSAAPVASAVAALPVPATPPAAPKHYKLVLHTGDSTVGAVHSGLSGALERRFDAEGTRYVREAMESASIAAVAKGKRLRDTIAKHKPDLVILTLGTNDVDVPAPWALADAVRTIAKRIGEGRDCVWMAPPVWKKDTGIVAVIRDNATPCAFFDASDLTLERLVDGFHPSDKGGEDWAAAFWAAFRGPDAGTPLAAPALALPAAAAPR